MGNRKYEKKRVAQITANQKVAQTLNVVGDKIDALFPDISGPELGVAIVQTLTNRQLKHVLQQSEKFNKLFPKEDLVRIATDELFDRKLELQREEE